MPMLETHPLAGYETIVPTCYRLPVGLPESPLAMKPYTVFDLFCGTGGFSYGMERAGLGFETRFGIDVLPVAAQTFQQNHPGAAIVCGDIRKIRRA